MAVLLETSKGDLVVDLFVDDAPVACKNFLKLCKLKYYNNSLFHSVQRNFLAQTGDPTGSGKGGESVYGLMYGPQARFFDDEIVPKRRHTSKGAVGMASAGPNLNASQFYITLADQLDSLDEVKTLFGQVSEGLEVLEAMSEAPVDGDNRPLQNIRIRHTIVLDDPFEDPAQLADLIPDASPAPTFEHGDRLEEDWVPEADERPAEEIEKEAAANEAQNRAVVLEMIGDLPEAEAKPPSNVLFVCKLNPVTTEEDLEIIFSRFGTVTDCDIIRDHKTGDSLSYGFIGYDNDASCEAAYFKMNNVLIDDRRIRVDFSQSVAHIWKQFRRHGKAGGDASLDSGGGGGGRGGGGGEAARAAPPAAAARYIQLSGQGGRGASGGGGARGSNGAAAAAAGGMLFDDGGGGGAPKQLPQQPRRQRWDAQEAAPHRQPQRSRSRSSSRDRSRHKKHKKEKRRDSRSRSRGEKRRSRSREEDKRHDSRERDRLRERSRDRQQRHDSRERSDRHHHRSSSERDRSRGGGHDSRDHRR